MFSDFNLDPKLILKLDPDPNKIKIGSKILEETLMKIKGVNPYSNRHLDPDPYLIYGSGFNKGYWAIKSPLIMQFFMILVLF